MEENANEISAKITKTCDKGTWKTYLSDFSSFFLAVNIF